MTIKSIKTRGIALVLAAGIMMGAGAPALAGRARAAEAQTVTEVTTDNAEQNTYDTEAASGQAVEVTTENTDLVPTEAAPDAGVQAQQNASNDNGGYVERTGTMDEQFERAENRAEYSDPLKEKAFKLAKEAGMIALEKGIDMLFKKVPFIDEFMPSIKDDIKELFGLGSGDKVSTKDLMDRFDSLEKNLNNAMDDQTKELINAMQDAFTAGTYRSDMKNLSDTVDIATAINTDSDKYTEEDRLVQLAMVVGNSELWNVEGSFIKELKQVGTDLIGKNYLDNRSMFKMLIDVNKKNYQFYGEAVDAVNPYVVKMMTDYMKYVAFALSSLTAQQMILSDTFNADNIKDKQLKKQYENFKTALTSIEGAKADIEAMVFGRKVFDGTGLLKKQTGKCYDNVMDSYKVFQNTPRLVHIPSGKACYTMIRKVSSDVLIDDNVEKTKNWGENCLESTNKKDFESRVSGGNDKDNCGNKNVLTADEMNKLFAHVKKVVAEKRKTNPNYTAWQYFYDLGFRVAGGVDDRCKFIIGDGYDEHDHDVQFIGSDWHTSINTASVLTGEVSSTEWKWMHNRVGLVDLINGNMASYEFCTYLFIRPGKTYDPENCLKEPELDVKGPRINGPTLDIKGPKI